VVDSKIETNKAKLGGLGRIELYGNPGTTEGRRIGGSKTISFFHNNPSLAREVGFIVRKEIRYPVKSEDLAELFGIMLGDGGLPSSHQFTISFNNKTDKEYSVYLRNLLRKLFAVDCHIHYPKNSNGADIIVSSSNLVDFLLRQGLVAGNKIRNQVDIPGWVNEAIAYQKACLRGLIDTDGSFYCHRYTSNGKEYSYLKLCFTNCSRPLLKSVQKILKKLNFKAYLRGNHVSIYSASEIRRYFEEIGTHNQKHFNKLKIALGI
jgi:intein/homing endonuclease